LLPQRPLKQIEKSGSTQRQKPRNEKSFGIDIQAQGRNLKVDALLIGMRLF
jgi:hypothetical protein